MADRLNEEMCTIATKRFHAFRDGIWAAADKVQYCIIPHIAFLPESIIKKILDNYALLHSAADLDPLINKCSHMVPHRDALWAVVVALEAEFVPLRAKAEAEKVAVNKVKILGSKQKPG
jgi:hypothetical protein